jgi:DNA helicase IV
VPEPAPDPTVDPTIESERARLAAARADLAAMRERTRSLDAKSGDAVSAAYLASALYRRARALEDDSLTPLFFGRIDQAGGPTPGRWYVGRRHVHDAHGDPVVVDWRAEVSRAFYRATRLQPLHVTLRRRFGFERGQLTAYEDEHLEGPAEPAEAERRSAILANEIERPRTGPMRDIVATIQPEQDVVVRTDLATSVCVQGAPGTGKTAVGLHRAAWLLYAHRDRLSRTGVLVVGPNRAFLHYIGQVLPALGEVEVNQSTVDELVGDAVPVRAVDPVDVALLKGDARMATVLHRAVWAPLRPPREALVVPIGSRRWNVPAYVASDAIHALRGRGLRYAAGRAALPQRLAHEVLLLMEREGATTDDRVQDQVARARPVKAYVEAAWPAVDPVRVVIRLLSDATALAAAADGVLTPEEQSLLLWPGVVRGPASAPWSAADAVLVDEVRDLVDRTPSLGHVVLDEAQDLSPMQLRAVGRRCSTGSATVLGDIAQGTTPWSTPSWSAALGHLGKPDALIEVLDRGYRVPAAVIDYASRLLALTAPDLAPPVSVREDPGLLSIVPATSPAQAVVDAVDEAYTALAREGSVGLIAADARVAEVSAELDARGAAYDLLGQDEETDARLSLVPASLAKGLEFDWVVVLEPADIVAAEPRGLRRLYVVLTRAVSGLAVIHAAPLPSGLASPVQSSSSAD